MDSRHALQSRGFSLIELIVAISLSAIVVAFVAGITTFPVQTYLAQSRRAELSESASRIWPPMERDLRTALPNSVRSAANAAANTVIVEMLATNGWARFRDAAALPADPPERTLDVLAADDQFSVAGKFAVGARPFSSNTVWLASNNGGAAGDAYAFDDVITPPAGTTIAIDDDPLNADEDRITITPAFDFDDAPSPNRRVFLVTGPVSYVCDLNARLLRRYTGYPIQASLASHDTHGELIALGATVELVTRNVAGCSVTHSPASGEHGDLVTMHVTVTLNGESMNLLFQGHVGSAP